MNTDQKVSLVAFLFLLVLVGGIAYVTYDGVKDQKEFIEHTQKTLAENSYDCNPKLLNEIYEYGTHSLGSFFPNGPFNIKDVIAIAAVESKFDRYAVGTHGEEGLFQIYRADRILEGLNIPNANIFDVSTNVEAFCFELHEKFLKYHDYFKAIVAYNGAPPKNEFNSKSVYWRKFIKIRKALGE